MRLLEFIKPSTKENTGNILVCPNHNILEKFNCTPPMKTLHGLLRWDTFIPPIKNAAFIKQQREVKPGNKRCLLMTRRAPLILISIQKIRTSYMLPCGSGAAVPGSSGKAGPQVVFIKAM